MPFKSSKKKRSYSSLYIKKIEKWENKKKKKKKKKQSTKEPHLEDQHLVFLFPIKFEQSVHVHIQQQNQEIKNILWRKKQ